MIIYLTSWLMLSLAVEGKLSKALKKFIQTSIIDANLTDKLAVADPKVLISPSLYLFVVLCLNTESMIYFPPNQYQHLIHIHITTPIAHSIVQ